jgi:imidazolonepropionase-like amidohydrolase
VTTVLRNVTLLDIDKDSLIEKGNITFSGDTIIDVSPNEHALSNGDYRVIEFPGCFALPGLIDLHTHLIWSGGSDPVQTVDAEGIALSLLHAAFNARKTLEAGITCVRDLGSNEDTIITLADAVSKGYLPGPRIISSGRTLIMTGGHDPFWGIQCDGPQELIKAVRKQVYRGAKVIKISATGGVYGRQDGEEVGTEELTREEIKAACDEAHRFGLRVAAHAISLNGIWNCIEAGVDTIEHGHFLTEPAMVKMKEKDMVWVPTLYVYRQIAEGKNLPAYAVDKAKRIVDIHRTAFKTALKMGVAIAAGSDAGSPNTPHGSLIEELEYMVDYGFTPLQAIKSATLTASKAMGMEKEIGSLSVGKKADIVVFRKNPLEDIASLKTIECVIKGGNRVI